MPIEQWLRRAAGSSLILPWLLSGCAEPLRSPQDIQPLLLPAAGATVSTTRSDPAEILAAELNGDVLELEVRFGGGCGEHDFSLIHTGEFMESHPVQTRLNLAHDAHGDNCRALLTRDLTFNLAPVKRAYRQSYAEHDALILHVHPPGDRSGSAHTLRYEF
jgi:hypothetical protein